MYFVALGFTLQYIALRKALVCIEAHFYYINLLPIVAHMKVNWIKLQLHSRESIRSILYSAKLFSLLKLVLQKYLIIKLFCIQVETKLIFSPIKLKVFYFWETFCLAEKKFVLFSDR